DRPAGEHRRAHPGAVRGRGGGAMIRRMRPWPAVALTAVLLTGGCGIPDNSGVIPVGPRASTDVSTGGDTTPTRNNREDTTDRAQFVDFFLEAAAGDPAGAVARVKQFLSPSAQGHYKKSPGDVRVIRRVDRPLINPGIDEISFKAREVGVLDNNGILTPSADGATTTTYTMTVQSGVSGGTGLFV